MTVYPMKLVRLTRDMRPWCAGQDALLPADTADRLIAEGGADNPRDRFGAPLQERIGAPKPKYRTKRD